MAHKETTPKPPLPLSSPLYLLLLLGALFERLLEGPVRILDPLLGGGCYTDDAISCGWLHFLWVATFVII